MDRKYIVSALIYGLAGLILGLYMAASHNHGQLVTHAHIMLVGFVVSFIYAVIHKLWLDNPKELMAKAQFYIHQLGTFGMVVALFLLYGGFMQGDLLAPVAALSSILVLIAFILMIWMYLRNS